MPNANEPLKSAGLGIILQKRLSEMKTNPRQLSFELGYAYDHIRKVYNGEEFPGKTLLKKICTFTNLDYEEMLILVEIDKALDKGWVKLLGEDDSALMDLKRYWSHLKEYDKQEIIDLARLKASR